METIFIPINNIKKTNLIIHALCLSIINCYIILPLNFNPVFRINETSPSLIMRNMVNTKVYANIELGSPKQYIQIPLDLDSNDFYISANAKYQFSNEPDKFSDIKFFYPNNSQTCIRIEEKKYHGNNFKFGEYYKDIFYFKNKNVELEFYLPNELDNPESGGIGLQLWPELMDTNSTIDEERTFLKKLKKNNLTEDYYWSIFYSSKDYSKKDGFILIGPLPHELNMDLGYYRKEYFDVNFKENIYADLWVDYIKLRFEFDEIYAFEGVNKEKTIIDENLSMNSTRILNAELEYNFGGIQAPNRFLSYFKNYFKEYISNGECFFDNFTIQSKKYFFYCKNDKSLIKKIKKNFPGFNFLKRRLNCNFDLIADDLFVEYKNYVYLLMFFHYSQGDDWIMGRPFLQKYQFIINPENHLINFYSNLNLINKKNEKERNNYNFKVLILVIVIIGVIIILLLLGYLLWKYNFSLKNLRKKRANELDDDYEYIDKKVLNKKEGLDPINE